MGAYQIGQGAYWTVNLDGLRAVQMVVWPGPVHEGNGTMQLIIDERARPEQRDALLKIMTGQDTAEMATMWWIYAAMCPTKLDPLFKAIEFEVDVYARRARLVAPGIIESSGEPIRNSVTGAEHRIRLDLPDGFEYRLAEMGGGRTKALGQIKLDFTHTYGQFARLHLSHAGIVD